MVTLGFIIINPTRFFPLQMRLDQCHCQEARVGRRFMAVRRLNYTLLATNSEC